MKSRKLGNSDLDLTVIGAGTWAIGGEGWDYAWGPQDERESIATLLKALEGGINWIDTAAVYGLGRAEIITGKVCREWGERIIVATKCGLIGDSSGHVTARIKRESIFAEVEESLRRLQLEQIDLYQIHWPNPPGDIDEAWQALLELKEQGKIRWAGVSNFSAAQLEHIARRGPITSLQPPYSLLKRDIERDILPWCSSRGTGVISYSPLQCGLLTEKVSREWIKGLLATDWRKNGFAYLHGPKLTALVDLIEELRAVGATIGRSVPEVAINWVVNQPGITAAIVGARRPQQIAQTLGAADFTLDEEQLTQIDRALSRYRDAARA